MGAIFARELKAYLRSLRSMAAIAIMAALSGLVFTLNNIRLGYPTLDASVATFSLVS